MRINIPGLGGRLRRARNETGLSQEAAAEQIDVSCLTIHRWEQTQRGVQTTFGSGLANFTADRSVGSSHWKMGIWALRMSPTAGS